MATLRSHVLIGHPADTVWMVVADAANISDWFPAMTSSSGDAAHRTVVLSDGSRLEEDVITLDHKLRRLQYRIVGGDIAVEQHLGTVDVIEVGPASALLVYSTEVEPESLAEVFHAAIDEAVQNLPAHLDRSGTRAR